MQIHAYIQILVLIPCNMTDTDTCMQVYYQFAIHVLTMPHGLASATRKNAGSLVCRRRSSLLLTCLQISFKKPMHQHSLSGGFLFTRAAVCSAVNYDPICRSLGPAFGGCLDLGACLHLGDKWLVFLIVVFKSKIMKLIPTYRLCCCTSTYRFCHCTSIQDNTLSLCWPGLAPAKTQKHSLARRLAGASPSKSPSASSFLYQKQQQQQQQHYRCPASAMAINHSNSTTTSTTATTKAITITVFAMVSNATTIAIAIASLHGLASATNLLFMSLPRHTVLPVRSAEWLAHPGALIELEALVRGPAADPDPGPGPGPDSGQPSAARPNSSRKG